jgi:outer membrane protein OmpA-like peptidoglycan-associated protein
MKGEILTKHNSNSLRFTLSMIVATLSCFVLLSAQESRRLQPQWWFGGEVGANLSTYSGSVQKFNSTAGAGLGNPAFTKGSGAGLFFAPLVEYRPDPIWGGLLTLGYDGRGGSFDDVTDAGGTHKLSTSMNYISVEPSVRYAPFIYPVYFFAGPRIGFNVSKSFSYTPPSGTKTDGEWSGINGTVLTGQIGAGYDFPVSDPNASTQVAVSPFVSFHFGQGPRSEESWSLTSFRFGLGVKFGSTGEAREKVSSEVEFSVKAPKLIPMERKVNETFPMRNYVFFDEGSDEIPSRYVMLSKEQAEKFKEEQLVQPEPSDITGRSLRQMTVYHNTLNILGDRMRRNPGTTVKLAGSSDKGQGSGMAFATAIKRYLSSVFGIDDSRISASGRAKPEVPSVQPGGTRELELVRPEDRRVDITSASSELLEPVKIVSLQEDPLDSDVLFSVAGAQDNLASWSVEVTDEDGKVKRYGPFTSEQERVSGKTILGDKLQGRYTVALDGISKSGQSLRKEETVRLVRSDEPESGLSLRFSILFEFDQSRTVATYDRFLSGVVAPLIPANGSVIIHGHTDIVGEESHNLKLSKDRAQETMNILQRELAKAGKRNVKFDTYGFGEDVRRAPFDNRLPEERFYNRTVIIDIVPEQ